MQIGNPELDRVCEQVIVPALKARGLDPKRVDRHNQGGLLKSEIVSFIENSEIIVADLTNERPNCYLEIGYAMGVDKYHALVLTAREDHNPDSPNYQQGGPKIHFDLSGYDILFWDPGDLAGYRSQLEAKIRQRQASAPPPSLTPPSSWDLDWLAEQRREALAGLESTGLSGFMEIRFALSGPKPDFPHKVLLEAANSSQVPTFGWPIGIVLTKSEWKPQPRKDGIATRAVVNNEGNYNYLTYDYWYLRKNGDFYLLKSLFEDSRKPGSIFADTRIIRITEALLYCAQLYEELGVTGSVEVNIGISHGGLQDRVMRAANPARDSGVFGTVTAVENEAENSIIVPLSEIRATIVDRVKELADPLFVLFDYFQPSDSVYDEIISNFVEGKVS